MLSSMTAATPDLTATANTSAPSTATDGVPTAGFAGVNIFVDLGTFSSATIAWWAYSMKAQAWFHAGDLTIRPATKFYAIDLAGVSRIALQMTAHGGSGTLKAWIEIGLGGDVR